MCVCEVRLGERASHKTRCETKSRTSHILSNQRKTQQTPIADAGSFDGVTHVHRAHARPKKKFERGMRAWQRHRITIFMNRFSAHTNVAKLYTRQYGCRGHVSDAFHNLAMGIFLEFFFSPPCFFSPKYEIIAWKLESLATRKNFKISTADAEFVSLSSVYLPRSLFQRFCMLCIFFLFFRSATMVNKIDLKQLSRK